MVTYAIGDVQGCYEPLMRLIERLEAHSAIHRLWFVGDVVNRGPDSLAVLRWLYERRDTVRLVLGNHDLHLLARWLDLTEARPGDTLDDVLAAPDAEELLSWLRAQPLWYREGPHAMVHAGLHPSWSIDDAAEIADELAEALRGEPVARLLGERPRLSGYRYGEKNGEPLRLAAALATFTRLRCLGPQDSLTFDFTGPLSALPKNRFPWWDRPHRRDPSLRLITGHWAALGVHRSEGVTSIDSGCVWGRQLTALCLADDTLISVDATPV